jgi:hypothetical protein
MTSSLEWQFGGWLRTWPDAMAWGTLAVVAVVGLWLVFRSYRHTSGGLTPGGRFGLAAIRGVMLLLLLLCLANPTRVMRKEPEKARRELAVVVDRSASMSQPDHRGATRLADAVRIWKAHATEAAGSFGTINHHRFDLNLKATPSFDEAVKSAEAGKETHLYAALHHALDDKPAAIVCLTDGLDTTSDKVSDLMTEATEQGVPLYFVVGNNQARAAGELMRIREVRIPARVLRQSRFTASALVEILSPMPRAVPMELWRGETKLAETNQSLKAGLNSISWSVDTSAGEQGLIPLEFRLGAGAQQQIAGRTARVVENTSVDLLYYQGALQWGYRFLRGALESDPSFRVTAILNPALGVQMVAGFEGHSSLTDLPEDARELKRFQIVVLAHAFADLMTPRQQQALLEYARGGGGVLFISPDTEATRRFSGTVLEQMLPVVFETGGTAVNGAAEQRFQEKMRAMGGASSMDETLFAQETIARQTLPELLPFKPMPGTAGAKLFGASTEIPHFNTYARVRAVKAGAEILAVHPSDRSPGNNQPCVLAARQRFGDGFTAVMNTDLLWRWKLSLPSTNRSVEVFWQQFFLGLAQPAAGNALELTSRTESPQLDRPVVMRVAGTADSVPTVTVRSPQGRSQRLNLAPFDSEGAGVWLATFMPDEPGCWQANAANADGDAAKISIAIAKQSVSAELMNLPPDTDGLRRLAEATGGALIESGTPVFGQMAMERPAEVLRAQPLWNNGVLVLLLLGAYATELVTRRLFKLL